MSKEVSKSDRAQAAASYISHFYQNVMALTDAYAIYRNLILEFKSKHGSTTEEIKTSPQAERDALILYAQAFRGSSHKAYIQYNVIKDKLQSQSTKIEDYYKKINKELIFESNDDLYNFVLEMNKIIVDEVIQHILQSNQDILNQVYNEQQPSTS